MSKSRTADMEKAKIVLKRGVSGIAEKLVTKTCALCGKEFTIPYRRNRRIYCLDCDEVARRRKRVGKPKETKEPKELKPTEIGESTTFSYVNRGDEFIRQYIGKTISIREGGQNT